MRTAGSRVEPRQRAGWKALEKRAAFSLLLLPMGFVVVGYDSASLQKPLYKLQRRRPGRQRDLLGGAARREREGDGQTEGRREGWSLLSVSPVETSARGPSAKSRAAECSGSTSIRTGLVAGPKFTSGSSTSGVFV